MSADARSRAEAAAGSVPVASPTGPPLVNRLARRIVLVLAVWAGALFWSPVLTRLNAPGWLTPDGLVGNVVSELLGFVASVVFTYWIVEHLLDERRLAEDRPLRERLTKVADAALHSILAVWDDRFGAPPRVPIDAAALAAARGLEEIVALAAMPAGRTPMNADHAQLIARSALDGLRRVLGAGDRVPRLLNDDIALEGKMADLESTRFEIEWHLSTHREAGDDVAPLRLTLQAANQCAELVRYLRDGQ